MLSAKKFGKPLLPILKHATTHGTLMLFALLVFGIKDITILVTLFIFQVSSHFTIDTLKGKVNKYFPKYQNPENVDYWILFGFDQFLHTIVIITMITYVFINI